MSGAFNIDIEVSTSDGGKIKIYCASLTDTWTVEHDNNKLSAFHSNLSKEEKIRQNKINLGPCPKVSDVANCELFLSRLGCTSAVLRIPLFHEFLNVPQSVRDGLAYASHKPFGKNLREGHMQKHPRFVRRGGGKKWIRLTKDEKGGSLICYRDEEKKGIISSIKIGASTAIQNLKQINNAFVVKSGKRQWVLQASSPRDYKQWQSQFDNISFVICPYFYIFLCAQSQCFSVKEFGNKVTGTEPNKKQQQQSEQKSDIMINLKDNVAQVDKLQAENMKLKGTVDQMHAKIGGMKKELDRLKLLYVEAGSGNEAMTAKVNAQFAKEKDALIRDYELQSQNLTGQLQELRRQIDAKTAMDSRVSNNKKGFGSGWQLGGDDDLKSEIDTEKKILDTFTEDERATIKFMHKHLHRHTHRHMHNHKHIHLHKNEEDNVDNFDMTDLELENKHTITHTITHSNTQFKIKNAFF